MTILLVIIYLAFISLGLPDSVLGSAWPIMHEALGAPLASAGLISMIISGGTILSSLISARLIRRFGTGLVTLVSVTMTALALLGISFADSFVAVCLWAVPLGLGAGSVDAALNGFVALHYKAAHMNWLHSFWGVGTSIGPIILALTLGRQGSWADGYRTISLLQFGMAALLLLSLPLWKKAASPAATARKDVPAKAPGLLALARLPKALPTLVAFFCYCGLEQTVMLWGSSYLVLVRRVGEEAAAGWISLFFFGITLGRMLSGFLALKLNQRMLIRLGQGLIALGVIALLLPLSSFAAVAGLFFIGFGCAPIYPSLLHETPNTFGTSYAQSMMGVQMASAYLGSTFLPPIFGLLGSAVGYALFPLYLGALLLIMVCMVGLVYRTQPQRGQV